MFHEDSTVFTPYLKTRVKHVKHVFSTCFTRVKNPTRRRGVFSRRRDVFFRMKGACFPVEIPCFWGFGEIHFIHFYPQFEGGIGWN